MDHHSNRKSLAASFHSVSLCPATYNTVDMERRWRCLAWRVGSATSYPILANGWLCGLSFCEEKVQMGWSEKKKEEELRSIQQLLCISPWLWGCFERSLGGSFATSAKSFSDKICSSRIDWTLALSTSSGDSHEWPQYACWNQEGLLGWVMQLLKWLCKC